MAGLKKPAKCKCGSTILKREHKPERWTCTDCGNICASRPQRNNPNECRGCGAKRGSKPFSNHGNICLECKSKYNKDYRVVNRDKIVTQMRESYQLNKKERQESVRRSIQRSPEAFITYLAGRIRRPTAKRMRMNPAIMIVEVDRDFLIKLYHKQKGECAITKIPLTHIFNDIYNISVDRIDSSKGYISGNVQLVCQWINHAKRQHSNADMIAALDRYHQLRLSGG